AASMKSRIIRGIEGDKEPIVRTFHSFCADILRKHGEKIGIKQDFKILLPDDAKIIMHKNFKLAGYYCHLYINAIGMAKDLGISIEDLEKYNNKKNTLEVQKIEQEIQELQFKFAVLHSSKESGKEEKA